MNTVTKDQARAATIVVSFHAVRPVVVSFLAARTTGRNDRSRNGRGKISQDWLDSRRRRRRNHEEAGSKCSMFSTTGVAEIFRLGEGFILPEESTLVGGRGVRTIVDLSASTMRIVASRVG